jgi:hypothetical protein
LQKWDSIADHRTGSEGDNATAEWLADEIRAVGLEPHLDRFDFQRRVLKECSVVIGETRIEGVPLFDGGFTGVEPIRAKLGQPDVPGTIALTHYTTVKTDERYEETRKLMAIRESKTHLAVISIGLQDAPAPGIRMLNAEKYNDPFGLPVLLVSRDDAEPLEEALKTGQEVEFRAQAELERSQPTNVGVTIKGKNPGLSPLVIMTPRSAWWTCTSERGGGITVWLECIRQFAASPPERDVIFIANTGHELGHLGLEEFLHKNKSLIKRAHAWLHLGANICARDGQLYVFASSDKYLAMMERRLWAHGATDLISVPVGMRPGSEALNIYDGEGQFVSVLGSNPLIHHPHDRWPHAVDLQRAEDLTRGLLQIARQLADANYFPPHNGAWATVDPKSVNWDEASIDKALDYAGAQRSTAVVILHRGRILAERYWKLTDEGSDSFNKLLRRNSAGHDIEDVASIQLEMSSGLNEKLEVRSPPGTKWSYNTVAYAKVMDVLEAATKMNRRQITQMWLTDPIGMSDSKWISRGPNASNPFGFASTARDLARFGLLVSADGRWGSTVVLGDRKYLAVATRSSQELNPHYGYLWWVSRNAFDTEARPEPPTAPADIFTAKGALGRRCYVVPSLDLVVTRIGNAPYDAANFDARFWELLMAAAPKEWR